MEQGDDPGTEETEETDEHTGQPPVTRGGLAGTAGDDKSAGISMSGVGQAPDDKGRDAIDEIVEGGARLGWGGTSNPTAAATEARDRILEGGRDKGGAPEDGVEEV